MSKLTPAQSKVVKELLKGKSNNEIAQSLGLSPNTVRNHLRAIFYLYEVASRLELSLKLK